MRVLYIEHQEADLLSALLYLGLCQELGHDNVVDWPWKDSLHGQIFRGHVPDTDIVNGIVAPYEWMTTLSGTKWSDEDVLKQIDVFDLVILASPRAQNTKLAKWLVGKAGRKNIKKLVILDGEDYTTPRWDLIEDLKPDVYFKLSMITDPPDIYPVQREKCEKNVRILPIPLALPYTDMPLVNKDIDIAFLGGNNWYFNRKEGTALSNDKPAKFVVEEKIRNEFPNKIFVGGSIPYDKYINMINRAKIAISVGGSGVEPLRTLEILACPNTMLIREDIRVLTPLPFIHNSTCAIFTSLDHLLEILHYYLNNEEKREQIAKNGNVFLRENFTLKARAQYLLKESC